MATLYKQPAYARARTNRAQGVRPSFFLVGAPRCGTTALQRWLQQHPGLYLPAEKECHYFAEDIPGLRTARDQGAYLRLFRDAQKGQTVGEASVLYLRSASAVRRILEFCPSARLLVTLRNPIDLVASWHEQLLVTDQEDVTDLRVAWDLQAQRRQGRKLPPHCQDPMILQYGSVGRLGEQVHALLQVCPPEQILFVNYEDLSADPGATYRRILAWLGVPDDGFDGFSVINANRNPLPPVVRRWWSRSRPMIAVRKAVRRAVGVERYGRLRDAVVPRLVGKPRPRTMEPEMREQLVEYFREDVQQLSDLLHVDYGHWIQP